MIKRIKGFSVGGARGDERTLWSFNLWGHPLTHPRQQLCVTLNVSYPMDTQYIRPLDICPYSKTVWTYCLNFSKQIVQGQDIITFMLLWQQSVIAAYPPHRIRWGNLNKAQGWGICWGERQQGDRHRERDRKQKGRQQRGRRKRECDTGLVRINSSTVLLLLLLLLTSSPVQKIFLSMRLDPKHMFSLWNSRLQHEPNMSRLGYRVLS